MKWGSKLLGVQVIVLIYRLDIVLKLKRTIFLPFSYKGDNFYDAVFSFLHTKLL